VAQEAIDQWVERFQGVAPLMHRKLHVADRAQEQGFRSVMWRWLEMMTGTWCRIDLGSGDILPSNSRRVVGNIRAPDPLARLGPYGPLGTHNTIRWSDPPPPPPVF